MDFVSLARMGILFFSLYLVFTKLTSYIKIKLVSIGQMRYIIMYFLTVVHLPDYLNRVIYIMLVFQ